MLEFTYNQTLFYVTLAIALFLPGYFFILAIESKRKCFSLLERFTLSFGISIAISNLLLILLGKSGIPISRFSVLLSIFIFVSACLLIKIVYNAISRPRDSVIGENGDNRDKLFSFSKSQLVVIVLLFFLTIFIKTVYLSDSIPSTSTDLGHHMYWVNGIIENGKLPYYSKTDIAMNDGRYQTGNPEPIADFIIGEHLIFASVALISGSGVLSSFPLLVLFLINILSILAIFILSLRLFEKLPWGKNASIILLFLIGPLYAISSAQAKFISGGVVGNILGNFFIPLALYFYWRAVQEKRSGFFAAALFLTFILFYTHHLSALIFGLVILVFGLIFFALNIGNKKELAEKISSWRKLMFSPPAIAVILAGLIFFFLVYAPGYIKSNAIETVIGSPAKSTKEGFSFSQLAYITGEARMALGMIGALILLVFYRKNAYLAAILLSWASVIFLMAWKPGWIHINIPSIRIANYLAFPISIMAALAIAWIFDFVKKRDSEKSRIPGSLILFAFVLFFFFAAANGYFDNSQSLKTGKTGKSSETFRAAEYLAEKTGPDDVIVKDHNYIPADSWMKIFFMRGYNYPFTRSFFFRYQENKNREHCTLNMISFPNSPEGQKCFNDLGVNFIAVNPAYDSAQFEKSNEFEKVYASGNIAIFHRN